MAFQRTNLTINGKSYTIEPGWFSLKDILTMAGVQATHATLNLVSGGPSQASSQGGNSSYPLFGGEVMTTSK